MGRNLLAQRIIVACLVAVAAGASSACDTSLGVEGSAGLVDTGTFTGITSATVLSPTSVKVTWNTSSNYSTYQIYSSSSPFPLGNTIFSSFTVTGLTPALKYSFSVGGVPTGGSTNLDGLSQVIGLTTWPMFTGLAQLQATSPISLQASWSFNDPSGKPITGPNFNVYVAKGGSISDFSTPAISTNATSVGITQLSDGTPITANTQYTVVVRATYLDGTSEFNENSLTVSTPSNISPLPTINSDAVILGEWPSFNVTGGLASYQTSFKLITYPHGPTGPTGTQTLGSVIGNNTFKDPTSEPLALGHNSIIPTVTSQGSSVDLAPLNVVARSMGTTMVDFPAFYATTGPSGNVQAHGRQRLGIAMAVGDFNCDGYQDLAVAAPYGNVNTLVAEGANDGAVYVYYGSSQGLITSPAPSVNPTSATAPQLITRPNIGYGYGAIFFGYQLAAGNINGDTNPGNGKACDDLAINSYAGDEVWIFFGSPLGLQTTGSPVQNSSACSGTSCAPLQITAPAGSRTRGGYFGLGLAMGKLHHSAGGDSYRDLIVGDPYEQFSAATNTGEGAIYIFYGGAAGINFINPPPQSSTGKYYTKINAPPDTGAPQWVFNFGESVAALDMNGDGIDDIAIGAPVNNNGSTCNALGAVYYLDSVANNVASVGYYTGTGSYSLPTAYTMIQDPMNLNTTGCSSYARWGGYLAVAGDINQDGYQDLIVTEGDTTVNWVWGWGGYGAWVIYGGASGPQINNGCAGFKNLKGNSSPACATNVTASCGAAAGLGAGQCKMLNVPYATSNGAGGGILITNTAAGVSANNTMNDVNGDGYADIILGWPVDGAGERSDVYYGSANGLQTGFSKLTPLVANLSSDNFGLGVALGNFNGSLYSSAAAAAPDNQTLNGNMGGAVFVYKGQSGGLGTNVTGYTQMLTPNLSKEGIGTAYAYSIGDVNGDGYSDVGIILARPATTKPGGTYAWYTEYDLIIEYGSANGIISQPNPTTNPLHPTDPLLVPTTPGYSYPYLNFVGAAGDTNGDGFADILAGDAAGNYIYVYFGSSTGLQVSVAPAVPPTAGLNPMIVANADGTSNYSINGEALGSGTNAVGQGDFNGDGYSDIIVGAGSSFYAVAPSTRGSALVIYGSALGPQTDGVLQRTLSGGPDVVLTAPCSGTAPNLTCKAQLLLAEDANYFGDTVAGVGDINKDGYADAIVSSPYNNTLGVQNGVIYVYMGSPTGLLMWDSTTGRYDNLNGSSTGFKLTPPLLNPAMTGRVLGRFIAPAGDVNGDGYADFMVSSIYESGSYGGAFLFYGCGNGLNSSAPQAGCPAGGIWGIPVPPMIATVGSIAVNAPSCGSSGCQPLYFYPNSASVATISGGWSGYYWGQWGGGVGDVNKDGFADVTLGTQYYVYQACSSSACPYYAMLAGGGVLFTGSSTGLQTSGAVTRTPACNGGTCTPYWLAPPMTNWGLPGNPSYYYFGAGMNFNNTAPADYNGDGYPDFFITSPAYMNGAQTTSFQGGMYFFY